MRLNEGIFDGHVHTHGGCGVDAFLRNARDHLSASGLDGENLICVRHGRSACITDAEALLAKATMSGKFTVYCNPSFRIDGFDHSPEGIRAQVQDFIDAGADGVKLADGEAGENVALDSILFDPLFSLLEETGFPALYHVGNPPYIPPRRVFQKIRFPVENPPMLIYSPGVDDDKEAMVIVPQEVMDQKYAQIENILRRHPNVHITFAHTFFLSGDLNRLAYFFDHYPNIMVDITPCMEIYYNLSQNPKLSREFFCDYRTRLIFGTDNTTEMDPQFTIAMIRRFLETDEPFFAAGYGFDVSGIAPLPMEVLQNVYRNNFFRICHPQQLDPVRAANFCEKLYETVKNFDELPQPNKEEVLEAAKRLRNMK